MHIQYRSSPLFQTQPKKVTPHFGMAFNQNQLKRKFLNQVHDTLSLYDNRLAQFLQNGSNLLGTIELLTGLNTVGPC